MAWITTADLSAFAEIDAARAEQMIEDATALALLAAPCLADLEDLDGLRALKAILRGAILRWDQSGVGALAQKNITTGPMTVSESLDTRERRSGMFWPSEIQLLQSLCGASGAGAGGVSMIDMTNVTGAMSARPELRFQWAWPAPVDDSAQAWW